MNDEKQSTAKIVEALAQKHHLSKTAASTFIKQMTTTFVDGLLQDGEVRIKGLGLFKIEWVESRMTVNVHNGEKQEISGHNKISFIPDKTFRETVNAPFAHLETIDIDEPEEPNHDAWLDDEDHRMKRFSEQAQEILSIISDLQEINPPVTKEVSHTIPNETSDTIIADQTNNESQRKTSTTSTSNDSISNKNEQSIIEDDVTSEKAAMETSNAVSPLAPVDEIHLLERMAKQTPKKNRRWMAISIFFALIVVVCIPIYYVLFMANHPQQMITQNISQTQGTTAENKQLNTALKSPNAIAVNQSTPKTVDPLTQPRIYKDTLTMVTFQEGSRLTLLSLKYYGNKLFWVYIYEANKNKITNPDQIGAGTRLMIPKLNPKLIDVNNPQCLSQAKALQEKYTHHSYSSQ